MIMGPAPNNPSLLLAFLAVIAPLVLGLILLRRSRRRVGSAPHCPSCDYLLYGNTSAVCPECGLALTQETIALGDRRRSRAMVITGLTLFALALLLLATVGVWTARSYDWYQLRPTAWVIDDAGSRDPSVDPRRAWRELTRRMAAGRFSDSNHRRLIRVALDEQANANQDTPPRPVSPITRELLDYLGDRHVAGQLSADDAKRFFENSARVHVRVRSVVVRDDLAPVEVSHVSNTPAGTWWLQYDDTTLTSPPTTRPIVAGGSSGMTSGMMAVGATTFRINAPPPGDHPLTVTQRFRVFQGKSFEPTRSKMLHEWTATTQATLHVVDRLPPELALKRVEDPNLAAAVRAAISAKEIRLDGNPAPTRSPRATAEIGLANPPAGIAFDVFVRSPAGKEFRLGDVYLAKNGNTNWVVSETWPKDWPTDLKTVDLVFRPNERVARQSIDLFEMWNAEVVISGVPVVRTGK
jgi:hypothetical protein